MAETEDRGITGGAPKSRLRRAIARLPYLLRALGLVWGASRGWTAAWLALLALQGALPAATVYLTKALVDSLTAVLGSGGGWAALRPTVLLAAAMGGVLLAGQLLGFIAGLVRTAQGQAVTDHVTDLVHRQCLRLDLGFFDSAQYFDRLHRARAEATYRPLSVVESLGGLLRSGVTLAAMAAVLLPYGAWLPVVLFVTTLPALYIALHYQGREHRHQVRIAPDERRVWYYDWLITGREAAAEVRLFGVGDRLRTAHRALRRRLHLQRLRLSRTEGLAQLLAGTLALLVTGGAMAWVGWRAARGHGTLGDMALFYAAFSPGQGLMRSILDGLAQTLGNSLFIGDLFEFLATEPRVAEPANPLPWPPARDRVGSAPTPDPAPIGPAIRFRGVSFSYPGGSRQVLCQLDLEIPAGQVAAIVGPNGAGKSTLVKLLCRFYDPAAGSVEVDGVDVRDLSLSELRAHITVLFQDPARYAATARGNITLDLDTDTAAATNAQVMAQVEAAARAAGADAPIGRLPKGFDTLLGTWFEGGTDLSVGEWQRIALARAFMRQAPVIVLDEPTSAMDSWAEADWLRRFRTLATGRTVLVITHRFTTAMLADAIHVMEAGRIVESGSHAALVAQGGRYAVSWKAQMTSAGRPT